MRRIVSIWFGVGVLLSRRAPLPGHAPRPCIVVEWESMKIPYAPWNPVSGHCGGMGSQSSAAERWNGGGLGKQ